MQMSMSFPVQSFRHQERLHIYACMMKPTVLLLLLAEAPPQSSSSMTGCPPARVAASKVSSQQPPQPRRGFLASLLMCRLPFGPGPCSAAPLCDGPADDSGA